ncbi:MAG TPA: hypothetical protein VF628_04685 [Allosphingosinicella sp.]|jgi:hypothetical protein
MSDVNSTVAAEARSAARLARAALIIASMGFALGVLGLFLPI